METGNSLLLYLGVCLSVWTISTAVENLDHQAENVRWVSLDFTSILTWTAPPSDYKYTVQFSMDEGDWMETLNCNRISETECDLSEELQALDRSVSADIRTEPAAYDPNADVEDFPHTYSPFFNPYKQSNISAPTFTVEAVDDRRVIVNITDPLTTNHRRGKQMSIRDILKNDLMYKIIYHKSGSTGKRDVLSTTNVKEFMDLEAGHIYCFMVAAYVPLRPKDSRHGAWSTQLCSPPGDILQELGLGVWVGVFFILLTVVIVIVTVTVLCCRQRNRALQTTQSSRPV